jgi:putative ABC transport system permease protein
MMMRIFHAVRNLVRRDRLEHDLDDELRASFELLVDEKVRGGMDPTIARRLAATELHIESVKEQVRDVRAGSVVETLLQDARYAARLLRRNPLFTLTAAASLAIGIGATTTVFTVANGLLLSVPSGVSEPSRLVEITRFREREFGIHQIPYAAYLSLKESANTLDEVYGYELNLEPVSLRADGSSERVFANFVTMSYFDVLGVRAAAGRLFGRVDPEVAGGSPVVVLSDALWARRFNRDPAVIGRTVSFNGFPLTVVGVADERFRGMTVLAPEAWIPAVMIPSLKPDTLINFSPAAGPINWQLMVGGRLARGATRRQAVDEVRAIGAAIDKDAPPKVGVDLGAGVVTAPDSGRLVWSVTASSPIPSGVRLAAAGFLALLMSLVSVVLLIACANLAGVLLARATARRREIALRVAIGAGRTRLVRQLLTETVMLFLLGGAGGLVLARGLTSLVVKLLPAFPFPVNLEMSIDGRVLIFGLTLSFVAALLSGLAPAWRGSKADVVSALKDDSQAPVDKLRLRNAFVIGQVAFSILLVITAGILVRGLNRVTRVDRGFDARNVDTASLDLTMAGYTSTTGAGVARELLDRVRALPGVQHATMADRAPGPAQWSFGGITVPGVTPPRGRYFFANWTIVDRDYFATLRIPLLAGRDFRADDTPNAPQVAVLGESTARRFWPGADPVGRTLFVSAFTLSGIGQPAPLTVVGVVRDVRTGGPDSTAPMNLYVPLQQRSQTALTLLARTADGRSLAADVRAIVSSMNPNLPVLDAQSLERQQNGPVETQLRIGAAVAGSVGIVGLLLAAIGIYGVTAYTVTQRTREIGIRLSLGADRTAVMGMVLRQGMTLVAIGSGIGLLLGAGAGQILSGARFGTPPPDALMFAGAAALFALVGLVACYVPARRATRIGAMEALRCE